MLFVIAIGLQSDMLLIRFRGIQKMRIKSHNTIDNNQITSGVIWQQLLIYFFPLLFGSFFQQLYNTVDAVIVGRFVGKEALAAVGGSAAVLVNYFIGFFNGLSAGASVVISQYYGAKKDQDVSDAVHTSVALAIAGGVIIMLIGLLLTPTAIRLMGTPEETVADSILYLRIFFCGMVSNLVYNMGAGILRAIGDSRRPLYVLIVSCVANIVLDVVFVVVFGMGVAGVALATILCQTMCAVLVLVILARSGASYAFHLRLLRFHRRILRQTISIGLPTAIQSTMYSFSNILIQAAINGFSTDAVSAWAAIGKIDAIFWMLISSLGVSVTTFVGQNYGAGLIDRVRSCVRQGMFIAGGMTVVVSGLLYLHGWRLIKLFSTDPDVISTGTMMMRFLVACYITYFMIEILSGSLRGMGSSFIPMLISIACVCGLRILWLFLVLPARHTITTVMMSYPISWVSSSALLLVYYLIFIRHLHPLKGKV